MFYTAELENVYYSEKSDCFIGADIENNNVYLHSVLYKNYIPLFFKNLHTFLDKANHYENSFAASFQWLHATHLKHTG